MRTGDWKQVFSGRVVWPLDPRKEEIFAEDVAHGLSMLCRFGGHCRMFYSVAEHSVRVARVVAAMAATQHLVDDAARILKRAALLHDGSEAYLLDIPRPVKHDPMLKGYVELEARWQACVNQRFGLAIDAHRDRGIKQADNILLSTEHRDLMLPCEREWSLLEEPLVETIIPWDPGKAKREFLAMLGDLYP